MQGGRNRLPPYNPLTMNKTYKRQSLKVGDVVTLPDFVVVTANETKQTAEIRFSDPEYSMTVPFNFTPLGFSPNGVQGFMQPEHLPYDHVGFIMSRDRRNMVAHRSSNEKLQLKLDRHFESNGEYALIPKGGDVRYCKSMKWTDKPQHIRVHIESFLNKKFSGTQVEIFRILDVEAQKFHSAMLISKITRQRRYTIFVLLDGGVVYPMPGIFFL